MSPILYFAYPGDLQTRTGGYGYDRRLIGALRDLGWDVRLVALGEGFPNDPDLGSAEALLAAVPDDGLLLIDGLAFGVMDCWAELHGGRLRLYALVHHPLALETGLPERVRAEFSMRETKALAQVRGVVVTSAVTAGELVENFGVPRDRIEIAMPGSDPVPLASGSGAAPCILSVGSLTRRKGHDVLVAALAGLQDLSWTCRIVGNPAFDPAFALELERQILDHGLGDRVVLAGEVKDARQEFAGADIFALASRYEGYGMVFAEALAHGLPIVGCAAGAVPDVVPPAAGLLVPPDDTEAFALALRRLLTEQDLRSSMADAAAIAGAALPSWRETAATVASFLEGRA